MLKKQNYCKHVFIDVENQRHEEEDNCKTLASLTLRRLQASRVLRLDTFKNDVTMM